VFAIDFAPDAAEEILFGELSRTGFIQLNAYRERFVAPLVYWTVADYRQQWGDGIRRILDGQPRSCLITSMRDPRSANFIQWWPLYRVDDSIYVQNQLLFFAALQGPFVPTDPYPHVSERRTRSEDGEPISEWRVRAADIEQFLSHTTRNWR
jgi:hypothetical protein